MRSGLATMIGLQPDMEIVGEADNGRVAVELAQKLSPDVVLMDISMPELNGIDATRQIAVLDPPPKIIAVSLHSDQRHVTDALKAGASGYVVKDSPLDELILAIRAVVQGRVYLSPQIADGVLHDYRRCVPGVPRRTLRRSLPASARFFNSSRRARAPRRLPLPCT